MSRFSSSNLVPSDLIHGMGIRFWFQVIENQKIYNIQQCQMVLQNLEGYVNDLSNGKGDKSKIPSIVDINLEDYENKLEDRNEVMVIVLVLGIKFWQNTIEKQSINDVNHCKVIINYLQGFMSDLNKPVGEKIEIQQDPLDSIIKCEEDFSVDDCTIFWKQALSIYMMLAVMQLLSISTEIKKER